MKNVLTLLFVLAFLPVFGQIEFGSEQILSSSPTNMRSIGNIDHGDIDGDGDIDLLSSSASFDRDAVTGLAWHENRDGRFYIHPVSDISLSTTDAHLGDIDGDGDLDIVAAHTNVDGLLYAAFWYENLDGSGNFRSDNFEVVDGVEFVSMELADIDDDNDLDIIGMSSLGNDVLWLEYEEDTKSFARAKAIFPERNTLLSDFRLADLDGDGDLDLLVAYEVGLTRELVWSENLDGDGNFGSAVLIDSEIDGVEFVDVADVDVDGDLDIVALTFSPNVLFWRENENGLGEFSERRILRNFSDNIEFQMVDLDQDDDPDIVVSGDLNVPLFWIENTRSSDPFGPSVAIESADNADIGTSTVVDLNQDGQLDVVSYYSSKLEIVWFERKATGDGFLQEKGIHHSSFGVSSILKQDFDGDQDLDLVTIGYPRTDGVRRLPGTKVWWYENEEGTLAPAAPILSSKDRDLPVDLVDVDLDGDVDVLATAPNRNVVIWFRNDGDSLSSFVVGGGGNGAPTSVTHGNLNGDSLPDVLVAFLNIDRIDWYRNVDGNGFEFLPGNISINIDGPTAIGAADLDGDELEDVFAFSDNEDLIFWYKNLDANGNFDFARDIQSTEENVKLLEAIDLDGDQDMDLIAVSPSQDRIVWFENEDGQGNFSSVRIISTTVDRPVSIDVSDVDLDGDLDVLYSSEMDDEIGWLLNDGQENFEPGPVVSTQLVDPAGSVAFDLDDDGDLEVFAFTSDQEKIVWFDNLLLVNTSEIETSMAAPKVFPNPFTYQLSIDPIQQPTTAQEWTFELLDLRARGVFQQQMLNDGQLMQVELGSLPAGLYFYAIKDASGRPVAVGKLSKL